MPYQFGWRCRSRVLKWCFLQHWNWLCGRITSISQTFCKDVHYRKMAIIFWFLGTLKVRKMIGVWIVRHIKCSFPTCESTRWSVKVFKVSSEDSTSENLSSQRVSLPGSGLWGFELSGQVLEFVLSFWSATGILPCFFRSPSHCSQEPHLPWAAASDTGDHWTSRHPAVRQKVVRKKWFETTWWIWFVTMVWEAFWVERLQSFHSLIVFTKKALRTRRW